MNGPHPTYRILQTTRVVLFLAIGLTCSFSTNQDISAQGLFKKRFRAEPTKDQSEVIIRVQVYLDHKQFGPGKIDGAMGEFTRYAVAAYNKKYAKDPAPDNWYKVIRDSQVKLKACYTNYTIKKEDRVWIGDVPLKPAEQESIKYMYYRSLAEFVAERYHTDWNFLHKLNPSIKLNRLKVGDVLMVPNVEPFQIEDIEKHGQYDAQEGLSQRHLLVDTQTRVVSIMDKQQVIATFPITPGQERFIPRGDWKIVNMVNTPEFRYDSKMLEEGVRSDEFYVIPPGPNNPVGIFWAGLNKSGIGLHGTNRPETIGRSRSAGCIRLANWDAVRLPTLVRPGATVTIK